MNFTREPLIETVITPKDGYKLVVRSSKAGGQEEFFVDAVEVISFGKASFYRSVEKPKCFVVPVGDYEILEVRESRMVLKTTGTERGIKIGGGRETVLKAAKEEAPIEDMDSTASAEQRADKRRDKRRSRKKRGKGELDEEIAEDISLTQPAFKEKKVEKTSLIPPPSTLISETITRYKTQALPEENSGEEQSKFVLMPPPANLVEGETRTKEENEEVPF